MRRHLSGVFIIVLGFGVAGCGSPEPALPRFEIELTGPRKEVDRIVITRNRGMILFEVSSEFGIGRATLRPLEGNWPESIGFQMNLRGLESFVVNGETIYRTERKDDGAKGGYRIELPAGVTGSSDRPIEIEWVDFFRQ